MKKFYAMSSRNNRLFYSFDSKQERDTACEENCSIEPATSKDAHWCSDCTILGYNKLPSGWIF